MSIATSVKTLFPLLLTTVAGAQNYQFDDDTTENALNLTGAVEIGFLHGFDAGATGDVISNIQVGIGTALATAGTLDGNDLYVAIWDDPNSDGDPSDAVLLYVSPMLTTSMTHTDQLVNYPVTPGVAVSGGFFVGAYTEATAGDFPVGLDISSGGQGQSAYIFWDGAAIDPNAPANLTQQTNAVFLLRATGGGSTTLGTTYCAPAVLNSSGEYAKMSALGSASVAANDLTLRVNDMPINAFGFCIGSQTQATSPMAGGSQGTLCLGGSIGRFIMQIQNSGAGGTFDISVDLTAIPQPTGFVAAAAGETWNFQTWFRDANPNTTSNFSDGVSVVLN